MGFEQNPLASFKTNYRTSGEAKIGQKVVGDWNCLKLGRIEEGWVGSFGPSLTSASQRKGSLLTPKEQCMQVIGSNAL